MPQKKDSFIEDSFIPDSMAPFKAKPATAKGVDDPTRDMDTATLMSTLRDEGAAALLEPFSARGGAGEWKVPDILSGSARAAMGLLFGGPKGQVEVGKSIVHGLTEPITTLTTTKDPRERVAAGSRLVRDTIPALWGAGSVLKAPATSLLTETVPPKLMSGAATARQAVTQQGPVAVGEVMTYPKASILKAAAGPILRGGARVAEETASMLGKRKPGTTAAMAAPEVIPDEAAIAAGLEESARRSDLRQAPNRPPTFTENVVDQSPTGAVPSTYKPAPDTGLPDMSKPVMTSADLNKWMNVKETQMMYGKNPGERILSENLLGPDKVTTLRNVTTARKSVGTSMEEAFKRAEAETVKPATLKRNTKLEEGYSYHATNESALDQIRLSGKLKASHPGDTQGGIPEWTDGGTGPRAHFSGDNPVAYVSEGRPVVLRTKRTVSKDSFNNDLYIAEDVPLSDLEFLGEDGAWHPVSGKGMRFNLESDIQAAIADAKKTYGKSTDETFMKAIEGIESEIVSRTEDLKNMTPSAAHELEVELGRGVKWTGASNDVQRLLKDIRGRISKKLKTIDGIVPLKERWGDLFEGEQALKSSIRKDAMGRGTGSVLNRK